MSAKNADDDLRYVETAMGSALETMLVYNLLRTHLFLGPFIDADLREQRVTAAQFNTLLVLREMGSRGLLMGEIGQRLVVTKSNITGLVDRLERQGLVRRAEHPDRRSTPVCITPEGIALLEDLIPRHKRLLTGLSEGLTQKEKQTLIGLLTKLRKLLRKRTEAES